MNTRSLVLIAGVTLAGAAGAGAILSLRARDQVLRSYEASVVAELALNRRLAAKLTQSSPTSRATPAKEDSTTEPRANESRPIVNPNELDAKFLTFLRQLPEYEPCLRARRQRDAMRYYGEWFLQLSVTPQRLAIIKQCIADDFAAQTGAFTAAVGSSSNRSSAEYRDRLRRVSEESDARVQQVLTTDEFSSYKAFMQVKTWTSHFNEINAYFEERGVAPLGADQRRAFTEACVKAQEWAAQQNPGPPAGVSYRTKNELIAASTAPALTPAQREALGGYLGFLTQRSSLLAQLLRPDAPDSVAYTRTPMF